MCLLENLLSISFYISKHIFFYEHISFCDKSHEKMWRNMHDCHFIIFYLHNEDHRDMFWTVKFLTIRTTETSFFVLSSFRINKIVALSQRHNLTDSPPSPSTFCSKIFYWFPDVLGHSKSFGAKKNSKKFLSGT